MNTTKVFSSSILTIFFRLVCALIILGLPAIGSAFTAGKLVTVSNNMLVGVSDSRDPSVTRLVVPIHGWYGVTAVAANYIGGNKYLKSNEWLTAFGEIDASLSGTDWKLAAYDWSLDSQKFFPGDAALKAHIHGEYLSTLLNERYPNLREVHFIGHSAGTWAINSAITGLLAKNRFVVVQGTLLDSFVPADLIGGLTSKGQLTTKNMSNLPFVGNRGDRIYLLDHYTDDYLVLGATPNTQKTFYWRANDIGNQRVDYFGITGFQYNGHSGPIQFYTDTIRYSRTGVATVGLQDPSAPFHSNWTMTGWNSSLFKKSQIRPNAFR